MKSLYLHNSTVYKLFDTTQHQGVFGRQYLCSIFLMTWLLEACLNLTWFQPAWIPNSTMGTQNYSTVRSVIPFQVFIAWTWECLKIKASKTSIKFYCMITQNAPKSFWGVGDETIWVDIPCGRSGKVSSSSFSRRCHPSNSYRCVVVVSSNVTWCRGIDSMVKKRRIRQPSFGIDFMKTNDLSNP